MPLLSFSLYTLAGSLVWNIGLIGAGYLLGERWQEAGRPVELFQNAVLIVIGVTLVWLVWRRLISPRLQRQR